MAINRYDTPAEARFINTYAPLPFEQLYTLGKEAKASVDSALAETDAALAKWSEFQSPSAVDTNTWYNETVGRANPIINEMAANPDLIKSAEGRARLQSAIRNVDRAKLSTLLQSRENLVSRQKMNQELMARGMYNPEWHNVDFLNYDTTKAGTFNDVSPLAYKSIQDLTEEYYKGIQDSFLKSEGGYDYTGVTPEMIANIADTNFSGVVNTPEAQKHMQIYRQQTGADEEQAKQWLKQRMVQDNLKYARINREENKFALQRQALADRDKNTERVPSKSEMIMSDLGLKKMALLGVTPEQAATITPEQLNAAYNQVYNNALTNAAKTGSANYMKDIWKNTMVGIEQQDVINYYHPANPKAGTVILKDKKNTFPGTSMVYMQNPNVVPLTVDGLPAAEISAGFIANNDTNKWGIDIKGGGKNGENASDYDFPKWISATAAGAVAIDQMVFGNPEEGRKVRSDKQISKPMNQVKLENYSNIVRGLYDSIDGGIFNGEANTVEYSLNGQPTPVVRGKILVPEEKIDAYLEANVDRFGGLSKREVKRMLTEGIGKDKKHRVMQKYDGNVKIDGEEMEGNYYVIYAGLPMFNDPNKTTSFDQLSTKDFRGTTGAQKEYSSQADVAYSNSWF